MKVRSHTKKGKPIAASASLVNAVQDYLRTLPQVPSRSGKVPSRVMIQKVLYGAATARYISEAIETIRKRQFTSAQLVIHAVYG